MEDQSYDPQCEPGRAEWIFQFFEGSARYDEFREIILDCLQTTPPSYDLEHLCGLAKEMAARGDHRARDKLRLRVLEIARTAAASDSHGAELWIALEGVSALLELAECYGTRLLADPDDDVPLPLGNLRDEAQLKEALRQQAERSPATRTYWNAVKKYDATVRQSLPSDEKARRARHLTEWKQEFPVERILRMASNKEGTFAGKYSQFGSRASVDERQIVLDRLLREPDEDVRVRLLWVFRRSTLPRVHPLILDWAAGPHEALRAAAISALAGTQDLRIHALARCKVEAAQLVGADEGTISLFLENYQPEDASLITRSLANLVPTADDAHTLASDLSKLASRHKAPNLAGALEWARLHTPCTICRHEIVTAMDALDLLDDRLLFECQFDAEPRLRRLADRNRKLPVLGSPILQTPPV
jgi:hypothetical protein